MSGLSEQGLPLDSQDVGTPLTLFTLGVYTKIGGSRDPPVPRETPAQNNEGLLVLSSVPPGTAIMSRPPYFYSVDQSKQSSWGEDFGNSPGKALLRTTRLGLSEQGPNPKGYANETPLLLFKCLIYITIGAFRHRQIPREFPAQIRPGFFKMQPPPEKIPRNGPHILIEHTDLHKSAPFSVPREYFFFRMQIGIQFHFPPLSAQRSSTLKLHLEC